MNGKTKKMRYGIGMRTQYPQGDDMVKRTEDQLDQARWADKLGFDSLMKSQHLAGYPLQEFQQMPFLARVMGEAPHLRLITGIVLLSLHKPLDLAEQLATIDVMSGGRLTFGAGLGYREVEFKGFGTTAKDRVPRFLENLEAIKRLWTEDEVTMKGSHFELDHVRVSLKPAQKPTPPIWIGANADAAIKRAAKLADAWFINPHQKMATIARQLDVYRRALDEAGKPFPTELPLAREIFIAPSTQAAMDRCGALSRREVQDLSRMGPGHGDARRRQRPVAGAGGITGRPLPARPGRNWSCTPRTPETEAMLAQGDAR